MATYGGSERNFKLPQIKNDGAQFWTKTDSETKKTTVFVIFLILGKKNYNIFIEKCLIIFNKVCKNS